MTYSRRGGKGDWSGSFSAGASSDNRFAPATIILSVIFLLWERMVLSPSPG